MSAFLSLSIKTFPRPEALVKTPPYSLPPGSDCGSSRSDNAHSAANLEVTL